MGGGGDWKSYEKKSPKAQASRFGSSGGGGIEKQKK